MEYKAFTLKSSNGLDLAGHHWEPEGDIKARILLIHGQSDHARRYDILAERFCNRGYEIWAADLPGHGDSKGKRGHINAYQDYLEVIDLLQDKVSKEAEQHPQILYGHSMGGNIILNYLLRNGQSSFQAAVCTSPWLRLAFDPPAIKLWLGRMVQGIWPSYSEKNTLDTGLLARDPAVAADYEADPLVHGVITARAFNEVHQAGIYALENRSKLGTQTLLMHGSADGIADFKSSKEFAQGLQQVEFVPWDGYYHELHNEPEKEEIFDRVLAWLDNQLSN